MARSAGPIPRADPALSTGGPEVRFAQVAVCVKHVAFRMEIDSLTGGITTFANDAGLSEADSAALALALLVGDEVTVVCVGSRAADDTLRHAFSAGAHRAVRCPITGESQPGQQSQPSSFDVAQALAAVASAADLVLCGAYSLDRGSGSVPAFLAAALGIGQALGCVSVTSVDDGLRVERRLERGRREVILVDRRAVVSVEGSVARLGRAGLAAVLGAQGRGIDIGPTVASEPASVLVPYRPRVRVSDGPDPEASPLDRIRQLTEVAAGSGHSRAMSLPPDAAAQAIVDQLTQWGYLP
jgi:electron transfer flavoprotein beta subunit